MKESNSKILFSKPATLRPNIDLPNGFVLFLDERQLPYILMKRFHIPRVLFSDYFARLYLAFSIFKCRKRFDAIVTGKFGEFFALLQSCFRNKKPHLLLDIEWPYKHSNKIRGIISKLVHKLIARGTYKLQVFCEVEADNYSKYFGIDKSKFVWIPYCIDVDDSVLEAKEENYVFAGGAQQRDYETLYYAVRDIPVKVLVISPKEQIRKEFVSKNMEIMGRVKYSEYLNLIAKSKLVVLSIEPEIMRCPGVTTYVMAMRMGKCVIVNESKGTKSYIINNKTGIIVKEKDPNGLRDAIENILKNDDLRRSIGENA
jgi:glycosyltransferase involved in cell wall biosynthesis